MPKYPHIRVALPSEDGNILAFLGRVIGALCRAGVSQGEIDTYLQLALIGDYPHLVRVTRDMVTIASGEEE